MNKTTKTVAIEVRRDGDWVVIRWDSDETWLTQEQATAFSQGLLAATKDSAKPSVVH